MVKELLRSYRIAHGRVQSIEAFETTLRENTPLISIADPSALVEYLNQVTLKSNMVVDELKRVSNQRDEFKSKLSEAEKSAREAWDEVTKLRSSGNVKSREEEEEKPDAEDDKGAGDIVEGDPLGATKKSPAPSIKSPTTSLRKMSIFSPKFKPVESPKLQTTSEDLFSYDGEIPRLEAELELKSERISSLEKEVTTLKGDLSVARESTQSMVQTLEEATRDVNNLRDAKERSEADIEELRDSLSRTTNRLQNELDESQQKLDALKTETSSSDSHRIAELESEMTAAKAELEKVQKLLKDKEQECAELEGLRTTVNDLNSNITRTEEANADLKAQVDESSARAHKLEEEKAVLEQAGSSRFDGGNTEPSKAKSTSLKPEVTSAPDPSAASKKKNKKKKKGAKSTNDDGNQTLPALDSEAPVKPNAADAPVGLDTVEKLQAELAKLQALVEEKNAAIDKISAKLKDQDGLQEEIESLKDDLVNVGQEHVETKERAKQLMAQKQALEARVAEQEEEIIKLQTRIVTDASSDEKQKLLASQFEELKRKAAILQTDLSAAQSLASSRFKDLNDLRTNLQKAQPEINSLRSEAAELKTVKETFSRKEAEFKRLDSRHEEMRTELASLKQSASTKDSEIKLLNQKLTSEMTTRVKAEEGSSSAAQGLQRIETEKRQANESLDRLSKELVKAREDMLSYKTKLREIEQTLSKQKSESEGLREEVDLKSAQYASAQSLMASMRDQTSEMATQLKEARERCESLDEEVAEAHRLLSERSREGETMRRLLADVESRADARVREMKERMDTAIEERDRAEDEASTAGRRRARELEDLRNKHRDAERNLKRAEEDRDELESSQKEWKRRREELEHRAEQSTKEVDEVRSAMGDLRDALDGSERQARELEKQKAELRRSVEETQHRLEKLQKTNKVCIQIILSTKKDWTNNIVEDSFRRY